MENIINQIITLDNDEKYIILNQAVYQNNNYYFAAKVTPDESDITDEFKLFEERKVGEDKVVSLVQDPKTVELLTKYFTPKDED